MRVRLQVTGGEAIRQTLATLDDAVSREVSLSALLAAAAPIVDTAARLCPRSQTAPHLADAIAAVPVEPGRVKGGPSLVTVGIGVPKEFFYDLFLEFGTKRQDRQSFYRPALDQEHAQAIETIRREYWAALTARTGRAA